MHYLFLLPLGLPPCSILCLQHYSSISFTWLNSFSSSGSQVRFPSYRKPDPTFGRLVCTFLVGIPITFCVHPFVGAPPKYYSCLLFICVSHSIVYSLKEKPSSFTFILPVPKRCLIHGNNNNL